MILDGCGRVSSIFLSVWCFVGRRGSFVFVWESSGVCWGRVIVFFVVDLWRRIFFYLFCWRRIFRLSWVWKCFWLDVGYEFVIIVIVVGMREKSFT